MKVFGKKEGYSLINKEYSGVVINFCCEEVDEENATWFMLRFNNKQGKPTFDTFKRLALEDINAETDRRILQDFVWNGLPVWLSVENQMNFKAAYDLAVQTQGASLPVTFKFGDDDAPQYHTFETVEDFSDFYMSAVAHINMCFTEGWKLKDSIEWEKYEEAINALYAE